MASVTTYPLVYSPIYDLEDENLSPWMDDVMMDFASQGGINITTLSKTILNINSAFNIPALKALGHTNDGVVSGGISTINTTQVQNYMQSRGVDPTLKIENTYYYVASGSSYANLGRALLTRDYQTTIGPNEQTWFIGGKEQTVITMDIETETTTGDYSIQITLSGADVKYVNQPREYVSINYESVPYDVYCMYQPGWNITDEETGFFLATYVLEFNAIEDNMIYAINNRFGFRHNDIFDSIAEMGSGDEKNIQNMWLCYAMPYQLMAEYLPDIAEEVLNMYNSEVINIEVDGVNITYFPAAVGTGVWPELGIAGRAYSGVESPIEGGGTLTVPLLIPLEMVKDMTITERYHLKRYGLCFITTIQVKEDLEWYQTQLFIAISWAIAIVMAAFGMPVLMLGMVTGRMASGLLKDYPELAILVGIIIGVVTFDPATFAAATTASQFSTIASFAQQAASLYLHRATTLLTKEFEKASEENKLVEDAMDEYNRKAIYMPFGDRLDQMYYAMYDMAYDFYDTYYDNVYRPPLPGTIV